MSWIPPLPRRVLALFVLLLACLSGGCRNLSATGPASLSETWRQDPDAFRAAVRKTIDETALTAPAQRDVDALVELHRAVLGHAEREGDAWAWLGAADLLGLTLEATPLTALPHLSQVAALAERAAALEPGLDQGGPHRTLGFLYLEAPTIWGADPEVAEEHFRKALEHGPRHPGNWLGLGDALWQLEYDDEAREAYEQAVQADATDALALADAGRAAARLRERFGEVK